MYSAIIIIKHLNIQATTASYKGHVLTVLTHTIAYTPVYSRSLTLTLTLPLHSLLSLVFGIGGPGEGGGVHYVGPSARRGLGQTCSWVFLWQNKREHACCM